MTDQFDQFLKESGHYFGPRVRLLVQVFCDAKEPLGAKEMLYRVKRLDPLVSFGTVYRFLTLLAASGLATTIPRERRGPLRFAKVTTPKLPGQCNHAHLVCKDCGANVQNGTQGEGSDH
jgi:Fe2+ or Zn2+ uptake regulation protein